MTVVIDVGCASYGGGVYSIERLITEFHPDVLYGFDPNAMNKRETIDGCRVHVARVAAWTYDGKVRYSNRGTGGTILGDAGEDCLCMDLAAFIRRHHDGTTILKADAEGSEYTLLEHLIAEGVDDLLSLAWIEFHPQYDPGQARQRWIEETIGCELAAWRF